MTSREIEEYYSNGVCCKMLCPIWDCANVEIPEDQDIASGEEYVFVVKPDKITLYMAPFPFVSFLFAPLCRSFDVHSVSKEGEVRITQIGLCGTSETMHQDVVGIEESESYNNEGEKLYRFDYKGADGGIVESLNAYHSSIGLENKTRVKDAVNRFLKQKRIGKTSSTGTPVSNAHSFLVREPLSNRGRGALYRRPSGRTVV
eukprot:gb/GECG01008317.1/.p1 GENE.gb/GECG01008317.1/~~gb/GECG01008317.1/.p1  ORF type:complete len:202 (+),score=21.66 gb/GECG01008317.1/:1-606(+)